MQETDKPVARLLREAHHYREIAAKAIRLRRMGQAADQAQEVHAKLLSDNPTMARSLTAYAMFEHAFSVAMDEFDKAVLAAAMDFVTFDDIDLPAPPMPTPPRSAP